MAIRDLSDEEIGECLVLFAKGERPLIMSGGEFSQSTREACKALRDEYNTDWRIRRRMPGWW